jgi:RHS repeat-associated protein
MKKYFFTPLLLLLTSFLSYAQTVPQGNNFGYTQGGFGVSDGGAATYSIPFVIPAGTAGLQPKIGLSYSSQSGNSFVGLGWSLTGLSSITRSSKTRAQDETADASQQTKAVSLGIAYNKSDRFSLDGERLVLAPDSIRTNIAFDDNYGNNQTIYYTEQNSFTRVILNENATSQSPQSFKAFTKSGLIFEYGNTTDSRVVDPTKNVGFQWLVNKIEDRKGNYMTFSYIQNSTSGEVYPDEINYTGNVTGGLVPYNKVKFIWEDRPDKSSVYGIRYQQKNTYQKRLKCVQVFYQTTLIREYKLSYDSNQYSLLKQIQECDGSSPQQVCFEPTIFDWTNIELGLGTPTEVTTVPSTTPEKRLFGDFNGDGLSDIATWDVPASTTNFVINFYLNNGLGAFINSPSSGSTTPLTAGTNFRVQVGEVNGDNLKDIIVNWAPASGTNNTLFLVSNPPAPDAGVPYPYTCSYYSKITSVGSSPWDDFIVDINEDGISDFVDYQTQAGTNRPVLNQAKISANLPTSSNSLSYYELVSPTIAATGYNTGWTSTAEPEELIEDINNDGLADFFIFDKTDGKNVIVFSESTRTLADPLSRKNQFRAAIGTTSTNIKRSLLDQAWLTGTANKISLADLNSDNLPDVLVVKPATNQIVIIPNIGDKGFEVLSNHKTFSATFLSTFGNVLPNDFNADGLVDLTFYETTNGTNRTYINEGDFVFNFSSSLIDALPLARFKDTGTNPKPQIGNFLKGSHSDFLYFNATQNKWFVQRMRQSQGFSIKKITNGAGLSTEIKYDNLLNSELYEKAGQVTFPNVDIQSPLYVVSKIKTITTTGDETAKRYRYCGATINVEGRGFRGFTKIIERDTITGIYDARYYRQGDDQWKYTGETVIKTERFYPNDVLIARTSHTPALIGYPTVNPTSFHAYAQEEITEDAVNFKKQKVRKFHDPYGNPTYVVVDYRSINDSPSEKVFKDSTVNVYSAVLPSTWLLGRLTQSTLYRFATGQPTETRQSAFEYDATTGLLNKETSDANLAADKKVVTTYTYDVFGNTITSNTKASIGGAIFQDHTVQSVYDTPTKRFVVQTTNSLGHIATATYDQKFGVPLTQTDPNGLTDTLKYDGFSRVIKQIMADGTWKSIAYRKASVATFQSPAESVFLTYTQSSNGQSMVEHFDSYNRGVQTKSKGFDGRWVIVDHTYSRITSPDIREVIKNNFPYYEGESSTGYTQKELDRLGRVIAVRETKTGGLRTATTEYSGPITDFINFKNQKKTDIEDVKDRVVESRWKDGNNVFFTYDAAGRLRYVVDLKGDTITNEYDARGLKIKMKDPNMGTYLYEYNGFGELTKQTYPKGDVVTMTYDKLGRMLTRQDPDGLTTNVFDLGNKGIGKLSSVNSYSSSHAFTYDNLGRKSQESVTVNGQTYTTTTTYDNQSRISTLSYPASGLVLKHVYNQWGFLTELRNNSNNALFWRLDSLDAKGNITLQSFGNGVKTRQQYEAATQYLQSIQSFYNATTLQHFSYKFNDLAHLTERKDEKRGNTETFDYDEVNRLIATKLNNNTTISLTYDVLGNILTKSDVGSYEYGTTNNGPHRLVNVRTNNANVQCSFTLNINTVYTSFNKVKEISNDTARVEVFYGPDQQRIMQKLYVRGSTTPSRIKLYIGGITEIEIFSYGKTKTTNFIGGIGMQVTETQGATTTTTLKYYLKDHLGSNTGFTGDNGVLLEEMSFDAWGQRRNADWTASTTGINTSHERGFTNHEHYDLFAMIDMNGRVYDPVLGRFLQADPYIQDMTDLQALNRYSYMDNNPLSGTDPTGYKKWWKKWVKPLINFVKNQAIKAVVNLVRTTVASAVAAIPIVGPILSIPVSNLAANFTSTILHGGSIKEAFKSSLNNFKTDLLTNSLDMGFHYVFDNTIITRNSFLSPLSNGVLEGSKSVIKGNSFKDGFYEGSINQIVAMKIDNDKIDNDFTKATIRSIGSGITKQLQGGSIVSGFVNKFMSEKSYGFKDYSQKFVEHIGLTGWSSRLSSDAIFITSESIFAGSLSSISGGSLFNGVSERAKESGSNSDTYKVAKKYFENQYQEYWKDIRDSFIKK